MRRTAGLAFVKPAEEANRRGEHEHALRLAAAGALLAEDIDFEIVPELWSPAARAAFESRTQCALAGHTATVQFVAFSPDGTRVVTGSDDNTARLWDASTGAEIAVLRGHTDAVPAASFTPAQRAQYFLTPTPPLWCVERKLTPYPNDAK
ncbi:MAG: hypothetical protein KJ622_17760 [Alphaproteobacteria bacterium]|nr:hypothetical protein [Alphaproteobacteria bacterium]